MAESKYNTITMNIAKEILSVRKKNNEDKEKYMRMGVDPGRVKYTFNKLLGNKVAQIFRNNIIKVLPKNSYKLSPLNSYIDGYPTEYDLIVLKKDAKEVEDTDNVYNKKDVVAVFEFKASGIGGNDKPEDLFKLPFLNIKDINDKIKFGYITFSELKSLYKQTAEYFDKENRKNYTTFCFANYDRVMNKDGKEYELNAYMLFEKNAPIIKNHDNIIYDTNFEEYIKNFFQK